MVEFFFFRFCFVECIEVIFTHHLWLCHIAYMCLQGRKNLKMSTFGMETEINKWCFIKIFSKNTIAPQLWTFSVSSTVWLADKLTIRNNTHSNSNRNNNNDKKSVVAFEDKPVSVCNFQCLPSTLTVWNLWKRVTTIKDENCSLSHILFRNALFDIVTYSYWSLYRHILHLWCIKGSL